MENKVALVTGGASGLGKAIARRLAADGAHVFVSDIQRDLGRESAIGGGLEFFEQDVTDETRWSEVIREIEKRADRLTILVNNAGILSATDAVNPENTSLANWKRTFAVNVDGVFLGCRAAIPAMRRAGEGSIINIASIAGMLATPYATAYGATKAAVWQLTKSVAQHCAQEKLNIRCNSVYPGAVRTPLWEKYAEDAARSRGVSFDEVIADAKTFVPMGDFTEPEGVSAAVSFLASDEARRMTGAELIVDGGTVSCDTYRSSRGISKQSGLVAPSHSPIP